MARVPSPNEGNGISADMPPKCMHTTPRAQLATYRSSTITTILSVLQIRRNLRTYSVGSTNQNSLVSDIPWAFPTLMRCLIVWNLPKPQTLNYRNKSPARQQMKSRQSSHTLKNFHRSSPFLETATSPGVCGVPYSYVFLRSGVVRIVIFNRPWVAAVLLRLHLLSYRRVLSRYFMGPRFS